jgi:glycosyltransferase involved in cell wall biosynthesis
MKKREAIRVIYISSYIPRKCGIATYTKDLTNAINLLNPHALAEILAINRPGESLNYPWEVKFKIDQENLASYLQAADYLNRSGADLVVLEHKFGLFGGNCGEYVIPLVNSLKLPLVTTFHTVAENPLSDCGLILNRLAHKSTVITVMMGKIREKLVQGYNLPSEKIVLIHHGIPDLPLSPTEGYKRKRKLAGKIVLGNINLLSDSKGIEYALEAVARIASKYPQVVYLIIGQTHPVVLQKEGEKYRRFLKQKIKKLRLERHVRFINKYLSVDELLNWLKTIDIYVTPYLDPSQAASGALAYAVGAGKPCVSTPYLYAKEVLASGRGILVPFKNAQALAEKIITLWENPERRKAIQKKAYTYGRLMTWSNVALQHLDLFRSLLSHHEK